MDSKKRIPTMRQISSRVCTETGLSRGGLQGLFSHRRSPLHRATRGLIVSIGRHYGYSYPAIAKQTGYKAHTSAMDAEKNINQGRLDGCVKSLPQNMKLLAATIIADLEM